MLFQANDVLNMYANSIDFTGVVVRSRKPIGVFAGVDNAHIPVYASSTDAIMEQVKFTQIEQNRI